LEYVCHELPAIAGLAGAPRLNSVTPAIKILGRAAALFVTRRATDRTSAAPYPSRAARRPRGDAYFVPRHDRVAVADHERVAPGRKRAAAAAEHDPSRLRCDPLDDRAGLELATVAQLDGDGVERAAVGSTRNAASVPSGSDGQPPPARASPGVHRRELA
jgi:hypothetical protein